MAPADAAVEPVEARGLLTLPRVAGVPEATAGLALVLDAVAETFAPFHVRPADTAPSAARLPHLPALAVEGVVQVAVLVGAVVATRVARPPFPLAETPIPWPTVARQTVDPIAPA